MLFETKSKAEWDKNWPARMMLANCDPEFDGDLGH